LRGAYIVADVPTPRTVALSEITYGSQSLLKKCIALAAVILDGPWVLWPVNKIVQYAEESEYFSIFNKRKTYLMGNGIDVSAIPLKKSRRWMRGSLQLIGVANVEDWHGYDRVIRGIAANLRNKKSKVEINFLVVGEGGAIEKLKNLTTSLGVESQISFHGRADGDELSLLYEEADIAIGSLGIHRKGLVSVSSLKDREYCAAGLPFVATGVDCDFPVGYPYRYLIPSTDEILEIDQLLDWYEAITPIDLNYSRTHALKNCDFEEKIRKIFPLGCF
jgi:hypothetical protein